MNTAISDDDATAPTISSTQYKVSTGVLSLTLSEDLAAHDSTKIVLYDSTKSGNVTFTANTFSESSAGVLSVTLSGSAKSGFEDLNHPRNVAILVGGVTDIWNNANTANLTSTISDDDAAAPTISSTQYKVSTGVLSLTLSEDLAAHDSTKISTVRLDKVGQRHLRGRYIQRIIRRRPLRYIERERKVRLRGPEPPQKCRDTGRRSDRPVGQLQRGKHEHCNIRRRRCGADHILCEI